MRLVHGLIALCILGGGVGFAVVAAPDDPVKGIMAEYGFYRSAIAQFEQQYGAKPGDFNRATEIWGLAGGEGGQDLNCYTTDSSLLNDVMRTCDGNGNGYLFQDDNLPARHAETAPEWFRAWQHLANAGLIDGAYPGLARGYPRGATPGDNVPESNALSGAGYTLMSFQHPNHPKWFPGDYWGLAFGAGPFKNPINHLVESRGPALTASQALYLDEKMDDGYPGSGMVRAVRDQPKCMSIAQGRYIYRKNDSRIRCGLFLAFYDPENPSHADKPTQ